VCIFLVVSGHKGLGYSYHEAGELLLLLGASDGIAMDGGSSARLVWLENTEMQSFPGALFYRAVPNHILMIK